MWLIAITEENSVAEEMLEKARKRLIVANKRAGCWTISTPPEQILQTKRANRNRLSDARVCTYCMYVRGRWNVLK